jgi:hypothetical protein
MGLVRKLRGSPRARRLGLVHGIDALVTIRGQTETSLVLDAAIAIQLPALPIGFTGGDSENFWLGEEDFFKSTLHLSSSLARSIGTGPEKGTEESLAREIVDIILKNARRTCLVLMPFSDNDRTFYDSVITGAVRDAGFRPIRLDDEVLAGHIPSHFVAHVRNASEVIVDITGTNPNVMYELGHVHHHGVVEPLILKRKEGGTEEIPFYLQNHTVIYYTDDDHSRVRSSIMEHLTSRRREAVASAET